MRRIAAIVALSVLAVVAYGKPRPREFPIIKDINHFDSSVPSAQRSSITAGASDTIFYGGTTWMPDSMRWEAIKDSVWTFDSGVGSSINTGQNPGKPVGYHERMEGWFGFDGTLRGIPYFRRSSTCAIAGSYSMWAGVTEYEASTLCYAAGQGYGNSWIIALVKTFQYPGSGNVNMSYQYRSEAEPGFDYSYVVIDTTGAGNGWFYDDIILRSRSGIVSGTDNIVLTPGSTLRSSAGPVSIKFVVSSDGTYSDEDGLFTSSCGHSTFDNVTLSGAITDFADFEVDEDGWMLTNPLSAVGDYSNLALADSLPPAMIPGPCSVQDSVLVFFGAGFQHAIQDNFAVSPWIDLKRDGDLGYPGRLLSYDVYANLSYYACPSPYVTIFARWYPSTCNGFTVMKKFSSQNIATAFGGQPFCSGPGAPWIHDLSNLIEPGAEQVQIAINVWLPTACPYAARAGYGDSTPWFDNVRFGVYGSRVAVPEEPRPAVARLGAATPNPLRSSTHIEFTMQAPGLAVLDVIDVAGRRIKTLVNTDLLEGPHSTEWKGVDDLGRIVSDGVYFYRLRTGDFSESRKLVVLRQ